MNEQASKHILIVEDEPTVGSVVKKRLEKAGFSVDWAKDGEEGLKQARASEYHLILLDVNLPILNGFQVLEALRSEMRTTPVLILSADRLLEDRIKGLKLGADDYLVKPFDFGELMARIEAILRRSVDARVKVMQVGDLTLDMVARKVRRGQAMLDMSDIEFRLLEFLVKNRKKIVSRADIAREIWGHENYKETNVIDVYMGYLRTAVDADRPSAIITETPGDGFILNA
ncbi:MAG: hypothetical protein A2X67_05555 [Ignavibacteria bacterium GWA2_55_11]|nr:MAG: hypothetical protein A2X67_05555 [Ignavibacteria bacterium GWA2_55_11]OGU46913.1 MAG: hypothetical protein A2X68_02525 [Ignavibacteria bacterium GWC2_56_12]OGU63704.1 MAG: hypothetical protein A3C56_04605 [Ignavibacteria bacterium RIFCSPHIGHO2_02_FULL_56_12]OGU72975.1 MAG: hypothetical protein A3G43_01485 [Ignavibacteria bacterium RIFCSPLOWO2_12_FULL_56_21]OGU73727.1 MAG: hypothetical protein A3H45_03555 [Ignavibacteria bacterium RIFCSPLOWO2_02_FULL_55_14]HAV23741.1 DNA-binding respons